MTTGTFTKNGNAKLGKRVAVVNRPAGESCPGATEWCAAHCYAKRGNFQRFGLQRRYRESTLTLPVKLGAMAMRWHASGDFDSPEYIQEAMAYMQAHPATMFWAYTRSWRVPELVPHLEAMRALPNMQLFASVDATTTERPPSGWRTAWIESDARKRGPVCMEQTGVKPDCQSCAYCWKGWRGDITFKIH
jgi:hypothetical protein